MFESRTGRGVGAATLLCVLVGLCVWYGTLGLDPEAWVFPRNHHVLPRVANYVGKRVVLSGEVVSVDPVVVSLAGADEPVRFRLVGVDRPVARGVTVRAYGVVESPRTLRTLGVVTTRPWGFVYAAAASILGGLLTLARLFRDWRIDRERWGLTPRPASPPRAPVGTSGESDPTGDDPDA